MEVSMAGSVFDTLVSEVRTGKIDFFLGVVPPDGLSSDLVAEPLYADEVQVIARCGHPLARRKKLGLADLAPYRWALSVSRGPIDRMLRTSYEQQGLDFPETSIVIMPLTPMRSILSHSNLIAAATRVRMMEEAALGQLVALPLNLPETRHVVSIVRGREDYLSPWAKELIGLLREVAAESNVAV
jgi:LysR family transcriptional regulator of gallate degradation